MSKNTKPAAKPAEKKPKAAKPTPTWRDDGSHKDSPPVAERTVRVRLTQAVNIFHCRCSAGVELMVTPEQADELEKAGKAVRLF